MMEKDGLQTHLPLTLEAHFEMQAKESPAVENLHSLWVLLRKDLEEYFSWAGFNAYPWGRKYFL